MSAPRRPVPCNCAVGLALPYGEWIVRNRGELAAEVTTFADEISQSLLGR